MFSLAGKSLYVAALDLWIDSTSARRRCYVSHGHADHARVHDLVITSPNNARVCALRFGRRGEATVYETHAFNEPWEIGAYRLSLFAAGHVLGSSQLLIEGEAGRFVYTGDFNLEPSYTAEAAEVKRCDLVLMECTYGRPQYVFPPRAEVAGAMVGWARRALEDGAVPIFYAYSLGKAQEALAILGRAGLPLAAHGAIAEMACLYERAGVALPAYERYDADAFDGARVLLWPPSGRALPKAVRGRPIRTAALTGWAIARGARHSFRTDTAFPLSDHADFPSLLRYVELAQPHKVLLNHGWRDFTLRLRKLGIDAEYLENDAQLALFS
ncbi:MAG: MBL fold metallo-hydrolase RNA specificity domain-containing protein [Candidatus Baltobacteraceae bacterium]|jgi:putative mRNA 3-end processing factor